MARTHIEGGVKVVASTTTAGVDTAGYGKVTLIYASSDKTVSVKAGDTSTVSEMTDASAWVIDPATGDKAGSTPPTSLVLSYVGSARYIAASDAVILLSEPILP